MEVWYPMEVPLQSGNMLKPVDYDILQHPEQLLLKLYKDIHSKAI